MADSTSAIIQGMSKKRLEAVIAESKKSLRAQQKQDARAEAIAEKKAAAEDEARYRAQEDAEQDEDPQAEDDDEAGTPKRRQKRRYWDNHSDEDAHGDSDEEMIIVSEKPQAKKLRGPQVVVGQSAVVNSKLPLRRGHSRKASTATTVTATSSPPRLPPASSDLPSSPTRPSESGSQPVFTPYKEEHSKFSTQGKQSPKSKTLLHTAYQHFRIKIALEDAFPDETLRLAMAKASFIEACQELKMQTRIARFNVEHVYAKRMTDSVEDRASQLRGEVKTKAQNIVSAQYVLASLSEGAVKDEVARLLTRGTFHFSDTTNRKGMFENMIIPMVISEQWFKRKSAQGTGKYSKHFNPCPLPLLALVITAVEGALGDWKTGLCVQSGNHFTKEEYNSIYRKHTASLEKYQKKFPAQFAKLQAKTWKDAWRIAGRNQVASGYDDDDLDDDDFEDIKAREGAASL